MEEEYILYSTNCPQCGALKRQLDAKKINYTVCTDVAEMKRLGFTHAPMFKVGDEYLNYSRALQWCREKQ